MGYGPLTMMVKGDMHVWEKGGAVKSFGRHNGKTEAQRGGKKQWSFCGSTKLIMGGW